MYKNILIALGLALSITLSVWAVNHKQVVIQTKDGKSVAVGSVTSPEISENHISVNGVTYWTLRQNMTAATSTICSFPNPAGTATTTKGTTGVSIPGVGLATSTLLSVSVQVTTATSTAATFDIATSTSPWASSTPSFMYAVPIASGVQFSGSYNFEGLATSTDTKLNASMPAIGGSRYSIGPAEFVNITTAGTGQSGTGYTYGGQCIARFMSLNAF